MDFARLCKEGKLVFVDGLSNLFGKDVPATELGREVVTLESGIASVDAKVQKCLGEKTQRGSERVLLVLDGLDVLFGLAQADADDLAGLLLGWRKV